jgi:putative ABC transport system ATP-binding protein
MLILELDDVRKSFHDGDVVLRLLRGIDLTLDTSGSIALTGASGSGKSTLLQIAAGLDTPDSGNVRLLGESVNKLPEHRRAALRREHIGFVFQQFNLLPGLSAHDNVMFQRRLNHMPDTDSWPARLVEALELTEILQRPVERLSGGEQQRVAIARAMAHQPAIVFADEPTGNLHDTLSKKVMTMFRELIIESGTALVLVTHSEEMAGFTSRQVELREGTLHDLQDPA